MVPAQFFTNVAVRGRVAFTLIVAEHNLSLIAHNASGCAWTQTSLQLGWKWVAGSHVPPKAFCDALLNDRDEGLLTFESQAAEEEKIAWVLFEYSVAYAGWHAYSLANEAMPELIRLTGENGIHEFVENALKAKPSNEELMDRVANYCINHCWANQQDVLGSPVDRAAFCKMG